MIHILDGQLEDAHDHRMPFSLYRKETVSIGVPYLLLTGYVSRGLTWPALAQRKSLGRGMWFSVRYIFPLSSVVQAQMQVLAGQGGE